MRYIYATLLLFIGVILFPASFFAQAITGPEQDCVNALPVCQNIFVQPNSYQDEGLDDDEINGNISCLNSGERNDVWYIFTVQAAGDVCFSIIPVDPNDDYDWAVFDLTTANCSDIRNDPNLEVSCNYAANCGNGITGANGDNDPATNPCWIQNENCIPVNAGETYVINVSNFSGSTDGYTLDFSTSTAVIFDNIDPELDQATAGCGGADFTVLFSENVLCSSVTASDFTITGPGGPYVVNSVTSPICATGGTFDDGFSLTVTPSITSTGNFSVNLVGTVEDNCGNLAQPKSISFPITGQPLVASAAQDTICSGTSTSLTTNYSTTTGFTFNWTPGNLTDPSPVVSPASTTIYTVEAIDAAGCIFVETVGVVVKQTPSVGFNLDTMACADAPSLITYTGNGGGSANYFWDFDNPASTIGSSGGPYTVSWNVPGVKDVSLIVEKDGCISSSLTKQIEIIPNPTSTFTGPPQLCLNEVGVFTYQGNAPSNATFNWTFPEVSFNNGQIGPYSLSWPNPGTKNICLQVEDRGCFSALSCQPVLVLSPPSVTIDPIADQCFIGNSFTFTTSGDSADTYLWDFGASALPPIFNGPVPPAVTYQTPGVKTIELFVSNSGCPGDTVEATFEVVEEPSADFNVSTTSTCSGSVLNITYQGTVLGPNQVFIWDFGAGALPTTSTLPAPPPVSYAFGGQKTISLTTIFKGCTTQTSQIVNVNEGPTVNAGGDVSYCEGDGGVQLDATVSGGTQPYFYSWSCDRSPNCGIDSVNVEDPFVNPNVTNPTEDVVFYFQVTDVNGCQSPVDSVVVTVLAKPKVDAGPDISLCPNPAPGEFLQGTAAADNNAPNLTFEWTPAAGLSNAFDNDPFARPDTTTIYTLVATSSNGCSSDVNTLDPQSTATVTVNPNPIVEAGVDTGLCFGSSIQLSGFAFGAGPDYDYEWTPVTPFAIDDPTIPEPTVSPSVTTIYTLSVTSNGCSGADSIRVQVDTEPTVNAGEPRSICEGETTQLSATASGDPDANLYSYLWTPGVDLTDSTVSSPGASPTVTTTYNVFATTEFGCISDADFVIVTVEPTPQVALLQADTVICEGATVPLVAIHTFDNDEALTAYSWEPVGVVSPPLGDSVVVVNTTTTSLITVTASSFAGKCKTTDEVLIEVNPDVNARIEADTTLFCEGDSAALVALGGVGNATYEWSPSSGLSNSTGETTFAFPSATTTYQVIISEGVCKDTADIQLEVRETPDADFLFSESQGCGELFVSFQQNTPSAVSYIWDFGDGSVLTNVPNPDHFYGEPGLYDVSFTAVGASGCEDVNNTLTVNVSDLPTAEYTSNPFAPTRIPLPNATVVFQDLSIDAVEWFWSFGDSSVSTSQSPTHVYTEEGIYEVSLTVRDADGCISTVAYGPFEVYEPTLFIPNVFTPNGDGFNDFFEVQYDGAESIEVRIFDRWGRDVFLGTAVGSNWDGRDENGRDVASGVYYYIVMIGNENFKGNITLMR